MAGRRPAHQTWGIVQQLPAVSAVKRGGTDLLNPIALLPRRSRLYGQVGIHTRQLDDVAGHAGDVSAQPLHADFAGELAKLKIDSIDAVKHAAAPGVRSLPYLTGGGSALKNWVNSTWAANSPWQNFFAVAVMALAATAAGGTALTLLGVTGLLSDHVAAWVQAIGSLIGLAIAIAVPWKIHEAGRTQKREAQTALLVAAAHLGWHTTRAMHSCSIKLQDGVRTVPLERLKDVQANFHLLMAKDVPAQAVPIILEILCEVSYHISAADLHNLNANDRKDKVRKAWKRTSKVFWQTKKLADLSRDPVCQPQFVWPRGPWIGTTGPTSAEKE